MTLLKLLLLIVGVLCAVLGVAGLFLPLLPGTPLLLLAAACFGYSSERMYKFLLGNRVTGPVIKDYRDRKAIRLKSKISALILLWLSIGYSAGFAVPLLWVKVLLVTIAAGVTVFILRIRTLNADERLSADSCSEPE